ncbi:ribosomal protein S12 methylthiotransferase RimO [Spirochaetia bacterium]|nr:ribosomal protein S12 methylthiotransferase RimO [Spirochaetia bacterium]
MRTYYIDPFGCVKNQVDAETMMAVLNGAGWQAAEDSADADLIIINSCGFIDSAKQESINAVLSYRKAYPGKKILLAGCLSQRYGAELAASLPEADGLFGNTDLTRAAAAADAVMAPGALLGIAADIAPAATGTKTAPGAAPVTPPASPGDRPLLSLPGSAYVKIAEGCNNRCTFCVIPVIRGGLRSRAIPGIVEECRRLLERGIRELCLIGQDLGSYGRDSGENADLPALLEALSALEGQFWVRLLYIHPDNFPLPILDLFRRDERFLPYFDIPFQHGSAPILRAMNRRGNADSYLRLTDTIRVALPDAVIRSTFLTGFPGETGEDFEALLDFQDKLKLDWAGAFAYSREEGTPAYAMKNRVPKKLAAERKQIIEERQIPISQNRMERFIGRTMDVLVEERISAANAAVDAGPSPEAADDGGLYLGRLACQAPEVDGAAVISTDRDLEPGTFVRGRVFARAGFDLEVRV